MYVYVCVYDMRNCTRNIKGIKLMILYIQVRESAALLFSSDCIAMYSLLIAFPKSRCSCRETRRTRSS